MQNFKLQREAIEKAYNRAIQNNPTITDEFRAELFLGVVFTGLSSIKAEQTTNLNEYRRLRDDYEQKKGTTLKAINLLNNSRRGNQHLPTIRCKEVCCRDDGKAKSRKAFVS